MSEEQPPQEPVEVVEVVEEKPQPQEQEEPIKIKAKTKKPKKEHHKEQTKCPKCGKDILKYGIDRHLKLYCKVVKEEKKQQEQQQQQQEKAKPVKQEPKDVDVPIEDLIKRLVKTKTDEKRERYRNMMSKVLKPRANI